MSPDLNSTENLWQELKVQINHWSPKNFQELECVTNEEWKKSQKRLVQISSKSFEHDSKL